MTSNPQTTQFVRFGPPQRPRPVPGSLRVPADPVRAEATALYNALSAKFPLAMSISASFTQITIPTGLSYPSGSCLWYSLINFDPWAEMDQDVVVFGLWCDMLSTNPAPTNPANQAAWGNDYGLGAAIVVGDQALPIGAPGTFSVGPCPIAGVEPTVTAVTNSRGRKLWSRTFPSGRYTTGFNKRGIPGALVPFVQRITKGNSLRAAFVLNSTDAAAGANKTVDGYVDLEIYFGLTKNINDLSE